MEGLVFVALGARCAPGEVVLEGASRFWSTKGRATTWIDVSLASSAMCVIDMHGKIVREAKVSSEPEALTVFIRGLSFQVAAVGLEAGPLSQWLHKALADIVFGAEGVSGTLCIGHRPGSTLTALSPASGTSVPRT
jgi:hypothetical protein